MEEASLLTPVQGIVSGVKVEDYLRRGTGMGFLYLFKDLYPPGKHGHARCLSRRGQSQVNRSGAAMCFQRFRVPFLDLRPDRSGRDCKALWRVRASSSQYRNRQASLPDLYPNNPYRATRP